VSVFSLPAYGCTAYGPEDDPHSVRCDGCGGYVDFEECRVVDEEAWCAACCREVRFPEPVPAPTEGHAGTCCGCGEELTAAPSLDGLCARCDALQSRAEAWQEVA
jgi:hypothetical protein